MLLNNDYEFRVFGLRRSGNHAIISWIVGHFPDESVYYFNDVQKIIEKKTFRKNLNFPIELFRWKKDYLHPNRHSSKMIWKKKYHMQIHQKSPMVTGTDIAIKMVDQSKYKLNSISKTSKLCLIQSYEDQPLDIINLIDKQMVGESKNRFNIIIIRDVRNMIASRLEHKHPNTKMSADVITLWKEYAHEYLDDTTLLGDNKVIVNYDLWVKSLEYRKELSKKLKLSFSDFGFDCRTNFGGGSSFKSKDDNNKFSTRYLKYIDNQEYINYNNDEELILLNEKINEA